MLAKTETPVGGPAAFWIVCEDPEGLRGPLVVDAPGLGGALAVFSFEEEALLYLSLRGAGRDGSGPRPTRVSRAELLALLVGRWADLASSVALDPIPEFEGGILLPLTTTSREGFVRFLAARRDAALRPRAAAALTRVRG